MIWFLANLSCTSSILLAKNAIPHALIVSSRYFRWSTAWWYLLSVEEDILRIWAFIHSSMSSLIGLSKNFISLGFFTSMAKCLPSMHPSISDIPGFANADFRFWYIPFFGLYRHSDIILSTFAHLSMRNSRMFASMFSSDCSIFILHSENSKPCIRSIFKCFFIIKIPY